MSIAVISWFEHDSLLEEKLHLENVILNSPDLATLNTSSQTEPVLAQRFNTLDKVHERIEHIVRFIQSATVIDQTMGSVSLGNRVLLRTNDGNEVYLRVISGEIAIYTNNKTVSQKTPVGKALLGKHVGSTFTSPLNPNITYTVTFIE